MSHWRWGPTVRVLSLLTAAFFVAGAVLWSAVVFGWLTGQPPGGGTDFLDETMRDWAWQYDRWPLEFAARDVPRAEMAAVLGELAELIPRVLGQVRDEQWDQMFPENVLGYALTNRQFAIHLFGHFSYHLGQVDYIRRVLTGAGALAPHAVGPEPTRTDGLESRA